MVKVTMSREYYASSLCSSSMCVTLSLYGIAVVLSIFLSQ